MTYVLFALLNALDVATTHAGLGAGLSEGNAIPAMVLGAGGMGWFVVFKAWLTLFAVAVVVWLRRNRPRVTVGLWIGNVVLSAAVGLNAWQVWG